MLQLEEKKALNFGEPEKDRWELVMDSDHVDPTNPITGKRGNPISHLPSGAGNLTNLYVW